jgi:multicomponent K+:H+ antiporter subunit F
MILSLAITFAFACFGLALVLNLWRLMTAPTPTDRILAVDTMVINVIALIVLYGVKTASGINFEAAMLFAFTGFVSTVAFAKYLLRGSIIE